MFVKVNNMSVKMDNDDLAEDFLDKLYDLCKQYTAPENFYYEFELED